MLSDNKKKRIAMKKETVKKKSTAYSANNVNLMKIIFPNMTFNTKQIIPVIVFG
jgi:hypothetical protein